MTSGRANSILAYTPRRRYIHNSNQLHNTICQQDIPFYTISVFLRKLCDHPPHSCQACESNAWKNSVYLSSTSTLQQVAIIKENQNIYANVSQKLNNMARSSSKLQRRILSILAISELWHIFTAHAQKRVLRSFRKNMTPPFAPAPSISYKTDKFLLPSDVYCMYLTFSCH